MVKTFEELADYAKKLLIENNEGIKKEDIIVTMHSDIDDIFKAIEQSGLGYHDVYGDEEIPIIRYNVTKDYESMREDKILQLDKKDLLSIYQGIKAFHIDGKTFFQLKLIDNSEIEDHNYSVYVFTEDIYNIVAKHAASIDVVKETNVPKNGVYKAYLKKTMFGTFMQYEEVKDIQSNPAIHQCKEELMKNTEFFFDNIPLFSKFNQKPLRKFLLCGEPGTGKTSICYDVAKKYSHEIPVVFVTEFEDMAAHIAACGEINRRTIVIFEDCEASLRFSGGNSKILNFLDGIDRPNIESGAIVMMTTNHPERIEARITKRPGRIDKIFYINALQGAYAYDVFNLYFGEFMKENNFDATTDTAKEAIEIIASGMTGAQIKELFNSYVCYMVSENKKFNLNDIHEVKIELFKAFKDIDSTYSSLDDSSFNESGIKLSKVLNGN